MRARDVIYEPPVRVARWLGARSCCQRLLRLARLRGRRKRNLLHPHHRALQLHVRGGLGLLGFLELSLRLRALFRVIAQVHARRPRVLLAGAGRGALVGADKECALGLEDGR